MHWIARVVNWSLVAFFKHEGWTIEGAAPTTTRKFVIIAAPHTSNWDFVYFLGAADALNLKLSFMGKISLFRWPFARLMRDLGGVPVDRSRSGDTVQAMADEFARRDEFMLTIAPEGTRGKAKQWKTGFYNIALKAGVLIVPAKMDYRRKVVALGQAVMPSGDYDKDMAQFAVFYRDCTPRHPERATAL
ncbi:lysophospholipid acyltransferase family protein [Caulobacter sp. ErkDOM-YI]|uniref:lysophospholipid acyltransferase family protein n=1 Tax=unclassified Caulobacter TaxID=2648921 RepID=UPI003AF7DF95